MSFSKILHSTKGLNITFLFLCLFSCFYSMKIFSSSLFPSSWHFLFLRVLNSCSVKHSIFCLVTLFSHGEFHLFLIFSYISYKLEVRSTFQLNFFFFTECFKGNTVLHTASHPEHKARSSHCFFYHLDKVKTITTHHFKGILFPVTYIPKYSHKLLKIITHII